MFIFDPTAATGLPHTPWSPIAAARTWEGARRTAANLLGVADQGATQHTDDAFWKPAGARYLAPLLLAAAYGQLTMREVLRWVAMAEEDELIELLETCPDPGAKPGLEALRSVWDADHRLRSSLLQTIATGLDAWQEPAITAATDRREPHQRPPPPRRPEHAVPDRPRARAAPPAGPLHRPRRRHHRRRVRALRPDRAADRPAAAARPG